MGHNNAISMHATFGTNDTSKKPPLFQPWYFQLCANHFQLRLHLNTTTYRFVATVLSKNNCLSWILANL
jgi:hypothetical protein